MRTRPTLTTTLEKFNQYLGNDSATEFTCLKDYQKEQARLNRDFYKILIRDSGHQLEFQIKQILSTLRIPPSQWGRYVHANINLYDFLVEVNALIEGKNTKLKELLRFIETNNDEYRRKIRYVSLGILGVGILAPFLFVFGGQAFTLLQCLLTFTLFVPVMSIFYSVGIALYSAYLTYYDDNLTWRDRFRANFFLFANTVVNISAYAVTMATAAVVFNPIAAALFVLASVVLVVKEAVHLTQLNKVEDHDLEDVEFDNRLEREQENARNKSMRTQQRNAVVIQLVASVVMVGIVAAWCLVPGGIFVTIPALAAIGLNAIGRKMAFSYNASHIKSQLMVKFSDLEDPYEETLSRSALELLKSAGPSVRSGNGVQVVQPGKFPPVPDTRFLPSSLSVFSKKSFSSTSAEEGALEYSCSL